MPKLTLNHIELPLCSSSSSSSSSRDECGEASNPLETRVDQMETKLNALVPHIHGYYKVTTSDLCYMCIYIYIERERDREIER